MDEVVSEQKFEVVSEQKFEVGKDVWFADAEGQPQLAKVTEVNHDEKTASVFVYSEVVHYKNLRYINNQENLENGKFKYKLVVF